MSLNYKLVNIPGNRITPDFSIGVYPVTNTEYQEFLKSPHLPGTKLQIPIHWTDPRYNLPSQPVVGVSWHDAKAFCAWLGLELPTSAKWESAAGPIPDNPLDYGWFHENSAGRLHLVGEKPPNKFGLYDMWGNVWEWTTRPWGRIAGFAAVLGTTTPRACGPRLAAATARRTGTTSGVSGAPRISS